MGRKKKNSRGGAHVLNTALHYRWLNKLCGRRRHNMPPPPASWPLTFWRWKWCPSHVWRGLYLCANFSLPRPLCYRLRPDVRDRQTDVRRASSPNASALSGQGHNKLRVWVVCTGVHNTLALSVGAKLQCNTCCWVVQWCKSVVWRVRVSQVKTSNCFRLHPTSMISKHTTIPVPDTSKN